VIHEEESAMRNMSLILVVAVIVFGLSAMPALAQDGPPPPPPGGGPGGPPMMGPGMPGMGMMMGMPPFMQGAPQVTMMIVDGVVYLACDGKLTAYDYKTLKVLAQVTYWEAPKFPPGMPGMPMGPGGGGPQGPPPAAP
jgi:hypothetical protein